LRDKTLLAGTPEALIQSKKGYTAKYLTGEMA
jgi:excinuclease UvrABC ATPase subunit